MRLKIDNEPGWRVRLSSLRARIAGIAAAVFFLLSANLAGAKDHSIDSRDIGCDDVPAGRARQICQAIASSLTWQWMGHATVAPGFKPSFDGVRRVYCELQLDRNDIGALKSLTSYDPNRRWLPDWRLQSAAEMLLRIIANLDGAGDEPETSVFNPKNADYVLKRGCP